ncbi:hypothetical protein [Corynebacterium variabile]|uniref:hypothetical protein n=1 Tax=Corynebacterium variabile TaxID=1727 RepID=UPI003A8F18A3
MTLPIPTPPTIITDPQEVREALASIDLTADALRDAASAGQEAASRAHATHPRTAKGLNRWIETVGTARQHLIEDGEWRISDPDNRPILEHTGKSSRTLSFASGDKYTGKAASSPNVARRKGPTTEEFFGQIEIPFLGLAAPEPEENWLFLYCRAPGEVRMEVSRPTFFNAGIVGGWHTRIILPALDLHSTTVEPIDIGDENVEFFVGQRRA